MRNPGMAAEGKEHLSPHTFHVFTSKRLAGKFAQQMNFISELEHEVPRFYGEIGSRLSAWQRKAPQIKGDRTKEEDVSTHAIAEDAEAFDE